MKEALIDKTTRYVDDFTAQVFVQMYPNGGTLEEVGAVFGVTRERIRQIQAVALEKLRVTCAERGITLESVLNQEVPLDSGPLPPVH